ncbi:hypothetical protein OIU84_013863 [Salix udensis]|uniref:Orn/DAP/Arg decarboxylase 2 C-terminal domain-containing protein n=1 Tax=Salix udensis TaxID=889485 RepID=A0AAD6JJA5_9ROSI|nr:hypothetical protein OIU84_013863 [Salix udensis]
MVVRYRKVIPDFEYKTDRFDVDELDANGTNWLKLENLADQILDNPVCKGERSYSSTVFGPTCDGLDTVLIGHQLPELQVDDWLVFPNMGAY